MTHYKTSAFVEETANIICESLSSGKSLSSICKELHVSPSTVLHWVTSNPAFAERYARARDIQCETICAEILDLSDNCRIGEKTEAKEIGRLCSLCRRETKWYGSTWKHMEDKTNICEGAEPERVMELKTVTADMIERSKLQVDARKWYLSKVMPKKYGDQVKHEVTGANGGPVSSQVQIVFVDASSANKMIDITPEPPAIEQGESDDQA